MGALMDSKVGFNIIKMRNTLLDMVYVLSGVILSLWAIFKWSELGFQLESKFYAGNRDGSFFLIAVLIGVALICYGLFDLFVLQRKRK
jgi:uncharacterized membrane protein YidH (DUF202 family)